MDGASFFASLQATNAEQPQGHKEEVMIQFNSLVNSFPIGNSSSKVRIVPHADGTHAMASSLISLNPLVNCSWPSKRSVGQLVAAHREGAYLAYGITTPGIKNDGMVRIWHRHSDERALLKGMSGAVKDLAFAHTKDDVILACVDDCGNLFVFEIVQNDVTKKLSSTLLLKIKGADEASNGSHCHRLIWCPYLPEEEEDRADADLSTCPSRLLVLTRDNVAEMWNVAAVTSELGIGSHERALAEKVTSGRLCISGHEQAITDAAFSPDGTALATASLDGQVKFFQVYMASDEDPRCLHRWSPHDGKPVSSLFFLDNHNDYTSDAQFWKYAVTCADTDSEIKVWSCESWKCLQTLRLDALDNAKPNFKAHIDLRAKYMLISDLARKSLYVLQIQEVNGSMRVVSASEFLTPFPFLSLTVMEAGDRKVRRSNENGQFTPVDGDADHDLDTDDDFDDAQSKAQIVDATVIDAMIVQPKSFQSCRIAYEDAWSKLQALKAAAGQPDMTKVKVEPIDADDEEEVDEVARLLKNTTIKKEPVDTSLKEEKPDLSQLLRGTSLNSSNSQTSSTAAVPAATATTPAAQPTLLSPKHLEKAPAPPVIKTEIVVVDDDNESGDDDDDDASNAVIVKDEVMLEDSEDVKPITLAALAVRSGNSSPSREVQDILATDRDFAGGVSHENEDEDDSSLFEEDEDDDDDEDDYKTTPEILSEEEDEADEDNSRERPQPATGLEVPAASWPKSVPPVPTTGAGAVSADTEALLKKLAEMTDLIQKQQNQVQSLKDEVKSMKQLYKTNDRKVNNVLKKSQTQMQDVVKRELDLRNHVLQQSMTSSLQKVMDKAVRDEMNKSLVTFQKSIQKNLQMTTTNFEKTLLEATKSACTSKNFLEQFSRSVGEKMSYGTQLAVKEHLSQVICPALERAFKEILIQMQATLLKHVDALGQGQQQSTLILQELRNQCKILPQEAHIKKFLHQELEAQFAKLTAQLGQNMSEASNGASTPINASPGSKDVIMQMQAKIKHLLAGGKLCEAFQMALSANNLQLVLYTCEMVNPKSLFAGNRCALSQSILLSLLQQLGHNLDHKTDLKLTYLKEGIVCLDDTDSVVQQHMKPILKGLNDQVNSFMSQNPEHQNIKQLKLLRMATQSYDK